MEDRKTLRSPKGAGPVIATALAVLLGPGVSRATDFTSLLWERTPPVMIHTSLAAAIPAGGSYKYVGSGLGFKMDGLFGAPLRSSGFLNSVYPYLQTGYSLSGGKDHVENVRSFFFEPGLAWRAIRRSNVNLTPYWAIGLHAGSVSSQNSGSYGNPSTGAGAIVDYSIGDRLSVALSLEASYIVSPDTFLMAGVAFLGAGYKFGPPRQTPAPEAVAPGFTPGVDSPGAGPDAPEPKVVLEKGKLIIREKLYFVANQFSIQSESLPVLDAVADVLKRKPTVRVRVEGHTDSKGDEAANLDISGKRAEAVVRYLILKGVEAGRLEARGYGGTAPIADNETEEGRSANRRVEFVIVEGTP